MVDSSALPIPIQHPHHIARQKWDAVSSRLERARACRQRVEEWRLVTWLRPTNWIEVRNQLKFSPILPPSIETLYEAAISGDWRACATATPADLMRPLRRQRGASPAPTAAYLAYEVRFLHHVPTHLLTRRVIASLWDLPVYSDHIQRQFAFAGESGDWGFLEPLLLTEDNACQPVDDRGQTCLRIAAQHQYLHMLSKQMLTLRAMLQRDRAGITPLSLAEEEDLQEVANLFTD